MFDVGLVSGLAVLVAWVGRRAVLGAPPHGPIRFATIAAVAAAIQLGFHAAATAALWMVWLSRAPAAQPRDNPDDDTGGGGGGGGGRGPDDGGPPGGDPPSGGDDVDWDRFEREFADYVQRRRPTPAPARTPD
jgi:hypothetical protein